MAQITHLSKAPITEALIDIRVNPVVEFPEEKFSYLKEILSTDYPEIEIRHMMQSEFQIFHSPSKVLTNSENLGVHGYFFKSKDKQNIAQFRKDGFTLNRLRPYSSWAVISDEAKNLWKIYSDVLSPDYVTRIAVRYINQMKLKLPVQSIEDFFMIKSIIPEGLPNQFSSFLHKVVLFDEETNIEANVIMNLEHIDNSTDSAVIFDIDVYKKVEFSPDAAEIWQIFEELRNMKNRIFFGYITEKTVKGFK